VPEDQLCLEASVRRLPGIPDASRAPGSMHESITETPVRRRLRWRVWSICGDSVTMCRGSITVDQPASKSPAAAEHGSAAIGSGHR
jgi:hypothetical protein